MYAVEVTLREVQPRVWRAFVVPSDITLPPLHLVLQAVMGWENHHLHAFRLGDQAFGPPDPDLDIEDERRVRLDDLLVRVGQSIRYEYDFGDDWQHDLVLKAIGGTAGDEGSIFVAGGEGACPPEDVGGVPGYADYVAAITDPSHEEHAAMIEWRGSGFDPNKFDVRAVNAELERVGRRPKRQT